MTNVAFRLRKVHALGDVVVLDVNTYDVFFGLPALVALRANLDFERRSIVLRNTGGKPYVVPMRMTLRTTTNVTPRVSPIMAGTLREIIWDNSANGKQLSKDANSSDEDDPAILELARQRIYYPMQRANARPLSLTDRNLRRTQAMILGEPLVQISRMADSLEPPRTLYEVGSVSDGDLQCAYHVSACYKCDVSNFANKTRLTQGMINFCVIVYMDDILVYSETYHGHAQRIEWTLGALRDAGFKIALEKSEFFLSEISFLGDVVTRGGLRPDSRKVATVKDAPVPTSLTQVRAFLGLTSYYHRFIKGFAAIVRPLTNLLRKDQPLSWDAECEQAFTTLKDVLAITPILIRPNSTKQFILITDWQPEAMSAILAQKGNDGREHVIEYASRTVSDERRNNSAPQDECYAVVWGIQHFHPYLYGQDHEPLLALKRLTNYTGMIGRWAVRLQEYDCDIIHRKTERHDIADGLTRLHQPARPGHRQLIVGELTIPLAQLVDDLPLDIISQCNESPVPRVISRTLTPYLKWSACLEEQGGNNNPPSQAEYLNPRRIIDISFFQPHTTSEDELLTLEEEEEENEEEDEGEEEEETLEEGSYSEHSEGEQSEEEEEEDEEQEESEWENLGEEASRTEAKEEDPEATARRREEIAAGKQPLEYASGTNLPISDDPAKDPEPPKPEDGDPVAETSSAPARRRRSRSPSPSTSPRPTVRTRTDTGHRASSSVLIPSSP
ncbi:hypothetical protein CBR_g40880 [Chara braunii]|uniref:Reverse transcriptase domain-containing protein n=1 Tax=Chara braunii TaxID=69332 RepID=A0A388K2A0_CHABU|nr:hypothetical protein CBR_g40880 [Chara braunii]|eukprot:GBG64180.1 hypothetical protein CBR_g40880 [Chara braunii]